MMKLNVYRFFRKTLKEKVYNAECFFYLGQNSMSSIGPRLCEFVLHSHIGDSRF